MDSTQIYNRKELELPTSLNRSNIATLQRNVVLYVSKYRHVKHRPIVFSVDLSLSRVEDIRVCARLFPVGLLLIGPL